MHLQDLYHYLNQYISATVPQENPEITALSYDSRHVKKGTLFLCKGNNFKQEYLEDAKRKGAVAYLADREYDTQLPHILVDNLRKALILSAERYFDFPQNALTLIGITGTKGKSTTVMMLYEILKKAYGRCGVISSIINDDGKDRITTGLTTPEPIELFQILERCRKNGVKTVLIEVSSQALKYERLFHIDFALAGFLNLAEDHVSPVEHADFSDYFHSKMKIFAKSETAFLNMDSAYLDDILPFAKNSIPVKEGTIINEETEKGFSLEYDRKTYFIPLLGRYNAENARMAIAIAQYLGISSDRIQKGFDALHIPGRASLFFTKDGRIRAIVDYAHNRLSFERIFDTAEKIKGDAKLVAVFGCVGEKAINRREGMGEIAGKRADHVILTADDPAGEPIRTINTSVIPYLSSYEEIDDRKKAVEKAFQDAKEYDGNTLILLLGKGDERTQKIGGNTLTIPSDIDITKEQIEAYNGSL